jgi:hypothetical protein
MRDHEMELIAALVEGRLDDESEARALIEASPELRREYQAQVLAFEALTAAGSVTLSETERSSLHRDVWTNLRHQPAASATGRWYVRMAAVAASLFVVVGVAAVLGTQGGPDEGGFAEIAADTADRDFAGGDEAASDGAETLEDAGATTTAAAAATDAPASDESVAIYRRESELLRQGIFTERLHSFSESEEAYGDLRDCIEEAGLGGYRIVATLAEPDATSEATATDTPRLAVAIPGESQIETAPIAFVDLEACEVVFVDE